MRKTRCWEKNMIQGCVPGSRDRVRPRRRWRDDISDWTSSDQWCSKMCRGQRRRMRRQPFNWTMSLDDDHQPERVVIVWVQQFYVWEQTLLKLWQKTEQTTASSQTVFELFQVLQLLTDRLVILRQLVFDRWQLKHWYCRTTSIHSLIYNTNHNLYTLNSITPNLFYPRALTLMINSST